MSSRDEGRTYAEYRETAEWSVVDRALNELVENCALVEATDHDKIVGYLCKALSAPASPAADEKAQGAVRLAALTRIRKAVREANPDHRSLVDELLDERRMEAERD